MALPIDTSIHHAYKIGIEMARTAEEAALKTMKNGPEFQAWLLKMADGRFGSLHTECILAKFHTQDKDTLDLLNKIRVLANYSYPVLIYGASGNGKDMLAHALHGLRANSSNPKKFVPINCTALPPDLIESELFGHRRGSFTGALVDRIGKFAEANDGTIFLDEIGDMPQDMQAKLLRVLQDGTYSPIGDNTIYTTTARVVCATNKNIPQLIKEGKFRQDLYDRLSTFHLSVPGLVERGTAEAFYILDKLFKEAIFNETEKLLIQENISSTHKINSVRQLQALALNKLVFGEITAQNILYL